MGLYSNIQKYTKTASDIDKHVEGTKIVYRNESEKHGYKKKSELLENMKRNTIEK